MNNNTLELYISSHPDASLQDYVDYLDNIRKEKKDKEAEREANEQKYFESMVGKYFVINFNNSSYCIVDFDKPFTGFKDSFNCYNLLINPYGTKKYSIEHERRECNKYWFTNNPYLPPCSGKACEWCKEITKEEFDAIAKEYNEISSKFNHIKYISLSK